jgi:hypothetical protein
MDRITAQCVMAFNALWILSEIKQRLEHALRPVEPPTMEEVLEQVSRRGVLRGPVDWAFPAWMPYVEYATQEIIKRFGSRRRRRDSSSTSETR